MAPKALGPLSTAFVEQLRGDCPSCPWWPEKRGLPSNQPDPLDKVLGPQYNQPKMTPELLPLFRDPGIKTVSPSTLRAALRPGAAAAALGRPLRAPSG